MAEQRYSDFALYRRLLRLARPYWGHLGGLFLLNLLAGVFALITPLPLKIAVDSVIDSHPLPGFLTALLPAAFPHSGKGVLILAVSLLVGIALLTHLQALATSLLRTYTGEKLVQNFRAQLFRHVQRLSLQYHDSRGTSDATYRIQYDAPAIQWITIDGIIPVLTASITLVHKYVHQTTFGMSERLVGAVVAIHGDDMGLVLPPAVATTQVVIVPVLAKGETESVSKAAKGLVR